MNSAKAEMSTPPYRLGYRPGLDGLRGAAILVVLWAHFFDLPLAAGFIGVNTFFVLSGFLITSLLVEEWDESGGISLPAFYARRALRLLPALLFLVACFLVYSRLNHAPDRFRHELKEAQAAIFYYMNWVGASNEIETNLLTHTWSLSLEEQFYLLWPLLLWLLLKFTARRSVLNFILLGIFMTDGLRYLLVATDPALMGGSGRLCGGLDTRADSLLVGCGIAVLLASDLLPKFARWKKTMAGIAAIATVFLGVTPAAFSITSKGMYYFGWLFLSLCSGGIILALALNSGGVIESLLENPWFVYTGKLSYSLYLWHYPVLRVCNERKLSHQQTIFFGLCATISLAMASYYLIERPCLRLKQCFARIKQTS